MEKDASEIAKLTERILKDPKSKLFVPLAEEYKKIGQIDMAVSVLTEGLKNNPGYATARSFLGRLLLDQGNLAGAQKELEEVVKAIPDNLLAQKKLGDIFILSGKKTEALARYKTALALNSSDKELASLVADIEAGKDVSARVPKPKTAAAAPDVKQPDRTQQTAATQPAGGKPATVPLVRVPGPEPSTAAAVIVKPVPQQMPAAPARPAPVASVPRIEEPAESVEEIIEIESLEQLPRVKEAAKATPVSPAETLPPIKSADVSRPGVGAFDLSEPVSAAETASGTTSPFSWEPAGTGVPEPEELPLAEKTQDDINTDTLAELYIAQGFYDKAIEIYQRMLSERPDNAALQAKLQKLHALAGGTPPAASPLAAQQRQPVPAENVERVQERKPVVGEYAPPPVVEEESAAGGFGSMMTEPAAASASGATPAAQGVTSRSEDSSREPVSEQAGKTAGGSAAVRRKETIHRLESWLKNIIKEKPE